MNYEYRIVCFIDILGFKDHVVETLDNKSDEDNVEKINSIIEAIKLSKKILHDEFIKSKMVTQFSDCIVISFKIEEESGVFYSLLDLMHLAVELAFKGFLIRGGVEYGKIIHTEEFVFGPGLNQAYQIESKEAIYPRILVAPSVLQIGKNFPLRINSADNEEESIMEIVRKDFDDKLYIDYIGGAYQELDEPNYDMLDYLIKLKEIVKSGYLKSEACDSTRLKEKFDWLKNKVNETIKVFSTNAKKMREIDGDRELAKAYIHLKQIE